MNIIVREIPNPHFLVDILQKNFYRTYNLSIIGLSVSFDIVFFNALLTAWISSVFFGVSVSPDNVSSSLNGFSAVWSPMSSLAYQFFMLLFLVLWMLFRPHRLAFFLSQVCPLRLCDSWEIGETLRSLRRHSWMFSSDTMSIGTFVHGTTLDSKLDEKNPWQ